MMYQVMETEMDQLSHMNTRAIFMFSAGSALGGFALNIVLSALFSGPGAISEVQKLVLYYIAPLCAIGAGTCYVLGYIEHRTRKSMLQKIKAETTTGG